MAKCQKENFPSGSFSIALHTKKAQIKIEKERIKTLCILELNTNGSLSLQTLDGQHWASFINGS